MSSCENGEHLQQHAQMQQRGLEPNELAADELLAKMQQRGLEPNGLEPDVSSCEKGEQCQQALGLLALKQKDDQKVEKASVTELGVEMQQGGSIPDVTTYNARINVCEKGHKEMCEVTLHSELGQWAEVAIALVSACEKGQIEEAIVLFIGMWKRDWTPDAVTYNSLISACEKGHKEEGHKVEKTSALCFAQQFGLIPTVDIESAMELFALMRRRGLEPNVTSHTVLISACVKGHEVEQLIELFAEMQQGDITPHHLQALSVRARKGHNVEGALALFRDMQLRGAGVLCPID